MPIYNKQIDMHGKPSEVVKQLAIKNFFMDHIREPREGEEIPLAYIVSGLLEFLDYLDSLERSE